MSASDKVSMQTEEVLRVELEFFRQEHRFGSGNCGTF